MRLEVIGLCIAIQCPRHWISYENKGPVSRTLHCNKLSQTTRYSWEALSEWSRAMHCDSSSQTLHCNWEPLSGDTEYQLKVPGLCDATNCPRGGTLSFAIAVRKLKVRPWHNVRDTWFQRLGVRRTPSLWNQLSQTLDIPGL